MIACRLFFDPELLNKLSKVEVSVFCMFVFMINLVSCYNEAIIVIILCLSHTDSIFQFSKNITSVDYSKNSFVYDFLTSMRQKINDPLGKRRKK